MKTNKSIKYFSLGIITILFLQLLNGCGSSKDIYYELPEEFRNPQKKIEFIEKYRPYIENKIDPGHGGKDRRNIGFEGNAIEADINLKVALALTTFLREAGAVVYLSRDKDTTVNLEDRSKMADSLGANILLSIHHNAPGKADDIWTNYTSTYYYSKPQYYDFKQINNDLAKYIQRDLSYAMRNSGGPYSFDGTYSDYIIYPGDGFSILRNAKMPAVLIESGFTTSHFESQRLIDPTFNRIEAWGIFRGLCRFFRAGFPTIIYQNLSDTVDVAEKEIYFLIKDSTNILSNSIDIKIDSVSFNDYSFDEKNNLLKINISAQKDGEHIIKITAANIYGIHSYPFERKFFIRRQDYE